MAVLMRAAKCASGSMPNPDPFHSGRTMPRICLLSKPAARALLSGGAPDPCASDRHAHTSRNKAEAGVLAGELEWIDGDKKRAVRARAKEFLGNPWRGACSHQIAASVYRREDALRELTQGHPTGDPTLLQEVLITNLKPAGLTDPRFAPYGGPSLRTTRLRP
jgi:hypothetical protein